jgi:surface polysaccharide O-acyltransferase-like enzyme
VIAFVLLILFHVGLAYAPWDWHAHSTHTYEWLREGVLLTGPWRLTLLFLVSGAALRFMSRGLSAAEVAKARLIRLLPPFAFGVLALVPVQAWLEWRAKGSFSGNLIDWYAYQFGPKGLTDGVPLNHMWFVLYIVVYSLICIALLATPTALALIERGLAKGLAGWLLLIAPMLYLAVARQELYETWGISNHLRTDWYNHAMSFAVFLFGFLFAGREEIWSRFIKLRWAALVVVAIAMPCLMLGEANVLSISDWGKNALFGVDQWAAIAAVLGFGGRYLRHERKPALTYLTDAVFPCYLAHQTILVSALYLIAPLRWPGVLEAAFLIIVTLGGSLGAYEIVRRIPLIRTLWGLRYAARASPPLKAKDDGGVVAPIATAEAA